MERELLGARVEVEQAQIELSDGSGDSGDIRNFCSFRCLCRRRPFLSQTEGCRCLCTRARALSRIVFWLLVKEVGNQDLAVVKDRHPRVHWLVEKQIVFSHVNSDQVVGKENVH